MGRWSATHRGKAVLIWVAVRGRGDRRRRRCTPMTVIDRDDKAVGEAGARRRHPRVVVRRRGARASASSCSLQSDDLTVDDPAFRAAIADVERDRRLVRRGDRNVDSPARRRPRRADRPGPPRGHGVVRAAGAPTTRRRSTSTTSSAAVDDVQKAHPDMYVGNAGVSTREGARRGYHRRPDRQGRHDRGPAHDHHPAARPRLADVVAGAGAASRSPPSSPRWASRPLPSAIVPMDALGQRGDPADRPRGRRRLLAVLHPPRARRAPRRSHRRRRPCRPRRPPPAAPS